MSRFSLAAGVVWLFSATLSVASPALAFTPSERNPANQAGLPPASTTTLPDSAVQNDGGYVPPNNGGPDYSQGSGTR